MKKITRVICLVLSLMLFVNLGSFEVLAADAEGQQDKVEEADQAQSQELSSKTETDITADTEGESPKENEDSVKDGSETEQPEVPDEPLPEEIPDADDAGDTDAEAPSEPVTESEAKEDKAAEEEQPEEEEPAVDVQAAETQTIGGTVEGITAEPADESGKQLKITWTRVADAVKYQVQLLKYADGTLISTSDTTDTSLQADVVQGEKYYVEVHAYKEDETGETEIAAGKIPAVLLAKPAVKENSSGTDIKLAWKAVAGADSYQVAYGKKTKKTSETSLEFGKLKYNTKYSFQVQAICSFTEDGKTYTYVSDIVKLNVATKKQKPAKVKKLTGIDGNESAILTWSKASRAESYIVYRYNATKKKWEVVKKDVKKLTYTDKKLKQGKKYKYRVAAYNNGGTGEKSSTITISVKKTPKTIRSIGYKAVVKSRAPIFTSKTSKKRVKYLKPGTKVTTTDYGKGRYKISIGGKTYWIAYRRLRFKSSIWTTKDYSTKVKEDFVNKKGYKSKSKYLIWISHYTQRVVIYQGSKGKWKVLRSGQCATGKHGTQTPKGVFKIKYKEKGIFNKYTYEKPAVYFKKGIAFHSRIKRYSGGYSDATIGRPKSHGCVRLMDSDINFIYKRCPKGTTVVSY